MCEGAGELAAVIFVTRTNACVDSLAFAGAMCHPLGPAPGSPPALAAPGGLFIVDCWRKAPHLALVQR